MISRVSEPDDRLDVTQEGRKARLKRRRDVTIVGPPREIPRKLYLVNWSRMSRKGSALVWYLAFPFTLMNVAYEMRPRNKLSSVTHRVLIAAAALTLTCLLTCWLTAIIEMILQSINLPSFLMHARRELALCITVTTMISVLLFRVWQESESRLHKVTALVHSGMVLISSAIGYLERPSEWTIDEGYKHPLRFFSELLPSDSQLDKLHALWSRYRDGELPELLYIEQTNAIEDEFPVYLDPIGSISGLSLILMVVFALLALVVGGRNIRAAGGAAIAILLSFSLVNLVAASIHAGLNQLFTTSQWIQYVAEDETLDAHSVWLMRTGLVSESTTFLVLASLAFIALISLFLLVTTRSFRLLTWIRLDVRTIKFRTKIIRLPWWKGPRRQKVRFAQWTHSVVANIGTAMYVAGWMSTAAGLGLIFLARDYIDTTQWNFDYTAWGGDPDSIWLTLESYFGVMASLSALVVFYLIRQINNRPALQQTVAGIADIAGFWPITVQPFGARTYRPYVVEAIADALTLAGDRPSVLIGHSQGSVIAPWALVDQSNTLDRSQWPKVHNLSLVTCGSPLQSLYSSFFPSTFDDEWFAAVRKNVNIWGNFWRRTDPIATALRHSVEDDNKKIISIDNEEIPDIDENNLQGHSDYWNDPMQESFVSDVIFSTSTLKSDP